MTVSELADVIDRCRLAVRYSDDDFHEMSDDEQNLMSAALRAFDHSAKLCVAPDGGSQPARAAETSQRVDASTSMPDAAVPSQGVKAGQIAAALDATPPLPDGWIAVSERLPEPGVNENSRGKGRRVGDNFQGDFECDDRGRSWWPEDWYESNESEETDWLISEAVTDWQPLPAAPTKDAG